MKLEECPNLHTFEASYKCERHLVTHKNILISLSGGSDSDIMLDFLQRIIKENVYHYDCTFHYVFFDTGIEYEATKRHLKELEEKYGITIERVRAKCPVPLGCKLYGLPFLSKFVSQMIERLQSKNFDFKNDGWKSFEELDKKYPKTKGALTWWCNKYPAKQGKKSHFNIDNNRFLKEFIIDNPPDFKISAKCCEGAKKNTSHDYEKDKSIDLKCLGLRMAEGGVRSSAIHSCFTDNRTYDFEKPNKKIKDYDDYRPIWWFTDKDKEEYKKYFDIKYSDCYEIWGFKRTGCCSCPFNSKWQEEMKIVEEYEPKLANGIKNIFGKSYEYTLRYREYKKSRKNNCGVDNQLSIFGEDNE